MGHRAYVPHIVRKGALHLGCALDFAYPHWGPDAFSYDLTTVGSQESGRLFALPSLIYRQLAGNTASFLTYLRAVNGFGRAATRDKQIVAG